LWASRCSNTTGQPLAVYYGFIEFRSLEECDVAQGLNQCLIKDDTLGEKSFTWNVVISRPKSYADPYRAGMSDGIPNFEANPLVNGNPPPYILHRVNGRENDPIVKQEKDIFRTKVNNETSVAILAKKRADVVKGGGAPEDVGGVVLSDVYGDWFLKDYGTPEVTPTVVAAPAATTSSANIDRMVAKSARLSLIGVLSRKDYEAADLQEKSEIIADVQEECIRVVGGSSSGYSVNVAFDLTNSSQFITMVVTCAGKNVNLAVDKIYDSLNGRTFGGNRVTVLR